eukprot:scaffold143509_cov51-Attheya_sp.AAC.2
MIILSVHIIMRSPPASTLTAKAGGHSESKMGEVKSIHILAATSRSDAACVTLHELFDETVVVPLLSDSKAVTRLLSDAMISGALVSVEPMAELMIDRLKSVGVKSALRLAERAVVSASSSGTSGDDLGSAQLTALAEILEDLAGDEVTAQNLCEIF